MKTMLLDYDAVLMRFGSSYQLKKALAAKAIFKVEEGVYSNVENPPLSAVICFAYPQTVLTMLSAFYHHGLTDTIPNHLDIAIPSSSRAPIHDGITVHYSPKGFHEPGIVVDEKKGFPIRVYSKERLLIELLRNKERLPYDLYKEVLANYRRIIGSLDLRFIDDVLEEFPKKALIRRRLDEEVL